MARNLLNDRLIRAAKGKSKPYRLADGDGLYLLVGTSGTKSWQLRYRYDGKQQTASLGKFSVLSLAEAREKAQEQRSLAAKGEHLTRAKHVAKARKRVASSATFASVAADWVVDEARRKRWTPDYKEEVKASLRNHLSKLDTLPVHEINAALCSPLLRKVEKAAPDAARKVGQRLRGILDYATERGFIPINPLPAARPVRIERKHLPALLAHDALGEVLRSADQAEAGRGVHRAHLLCAFTAQRIGEVVGATWDEVDLKDGVWSIPRERMKRKDVERGPHRVPLPPVLLQAMREWRRIDGDKAVYVCPARSTDVSITREAVEKFYRRTLGLAGKHGPHGWRTVFSSWAREAGKEGDLIEAQLDHLIGSKVQQAYDRALRLTLRGELMAWHEGALIAARDGAKVKQLHKASAS
jgi:integrase